jgi:hypothetical protein
VSAVQNHTEHDLRRQVARYEADVLYRGNTLANLEKELVRLLHSRLNMMGITPLDNGVFIKETLAPAKFRESRLLARQYQDTLRALGGQEIALIEQAIRAGLVAGLEKHQGQITLFSGLDGNTQPSPTDIARDTAAHSPASTTHTYRPNGVTNSNSPQLEISG